MHDHITITLKSCAGGADARVHANRIFVEDGRVFTSAGVMAGIDLALRTSIGRQLGHRVAATVARELVVYLRRSGGGPGTVPVGAAPESHPPRRRIRCRTRESRSRG